MARGGIVSAGDPACYDESKKPQPSVHVPLLVVGAGAAGAAAAIAAVKLGIVTMLVEEQPVSGELMALDVPLHFGGRMARDSGNARSMQQILESSPDIAEAYELGIDVQLGVCVWGIFPGGRLDHGASPLLIGLADEHRSWFVSCDRVIVAGGARDLCIGFPGWEKPGVMGAQAAVQLMQRYDAFTGSRMLILGGGATALQVMEAAAKKGIAVAGVVQAEALPEEQGCARRIVGMGVPYYAGYLIQEVRGSVEVESAVIVRLDDEFRPLAGSQITVACDTVVLAIGTVPNIELLDTLNCQLHFEPFRGGWVPARDASGATSLPYVYAIGDCAGLGAEPGEDGRRAARAVARSLGLVPDPVETEAERPPTKDLSVQRARVWMRAQLAVGGLDVPVCLCEEVSRREIVELRPPRYLPRATGTHCARTLRALGADGPLNQDQVKRLTRAGMGPCQGRRCREQVQILIEGVATGQPGTVPLARYRPPVRPLPMNLLAADDESAQLRDHWVAWFNISTQWLAHWEIKPVPLLAPGQAPVIGESE
jgi:thioredoxin reductase